jgi:hypothetical protein
LALDAANDALGTARKAASAAATAIFVTMVIPPLKWGKIAPSHLYNGRNIYVYKSEFGTDLIIRSSFLPIFIDVHVDERSFMKLKRPSSLPLLVPYKGKWFIDRH